MISPTNPILGQARTGVAAALVAIAAGSWVYLSAVAARMGDMSSVLAMPMTSAWSALQTVFMAGMWAVMMAAMMLPSAVPMVLSYDRLERGSPQGRPGSAASFVAGYALVWLGFAALATGIQWVLQTMGLVNGVGEATQRGLGGSLLIAAGIFQFSPMKRANLQACRTPMGFLTTSWRDGRSGALRMGLHHGSLCLRCCGTLMMLLFVLGVMNLLWVASLTIFVLVEKVSSRGERISLIAGLAMIVWGAAAIVA